MDSKKAIIFEIVRHISLPGWRFPNSAEYKAVLSELGIKYAEVNSELRVRFNGHNKAVKAFRCAEITDKHTVIIDGTLIEAGETFNLEKIMNTFQTINRARRMGKGANNGESHRAH